MKRVKFLLFIIRKALALSRPIGQGIEEKHEALTSDKEIESYELGLDAKGFSKQKNQNHRLDLVMA